MAKAPTSYIATTGTARTRTADSLAFPLVTRPQAMTIYLRFLDLESPAVAQYRYLAIVGNGTVVPYLSAYINSGGASYGADYSPRTGSSQTATVTRSVSVGSLVELVVTVTTAGKVQLSVSVNGGAVTTGTATAGLDLPSAWSGGTIYLTNVLKAVTAYRDILVVRGVHSLAAMRVRIGLTP